jgi:hypothetical protein
MSAHLRRRRDFVRLCSAIGLLPFAFADERSAVEAQQAFPQFMVFDGLLFLGKPDFRVRGLTPIGGSGELWRPGVSQDSIDEVRLRSLFEPYRTNTGFYYIDIENWPLRPAPVDARRKTIDKLATLVDVARATAPRMHLGFYGVLPDIAYWPLIRHDKEYDAWLEVNRELLVLANHVDAIFPSLYTFYDDLDGWSNYARQTLAEARRYGKPVYPFLWPEFHDSNPVLRGRKLQPDFWRAELDLCAKLADGIVLWGGWQQHWDEHAPWWQETLKFIQARGFPAPPAPAGNERESKSTHRES